MPAWIVQIYANVPAVGNVLATAALLVRPMFAGEPDVENCTVCPVPANANCTVPPAAMVTTAGTKASVVVACTVAFAGFAPAVPTTTVTLFVAEPDDAVMTASPALTPLTSPVELLTVATARFDEDQLTVAENAPPFWSSGVAVSCTVAPAAIAAAGAASAIDVRTGVLVEPGDVLPLPLHAASEHRSVRQVVARKV